MVVCFLSRLFRINMYLVFVICTLLHVCYCLCVKIYSCIVYLVYYLHYCHNVVYIISTFLSFLYIVCTAFIIIIIIVYYVV